MTNDDDTSKIHPAPPNGRKRTHCAKCGKEIPNDGTVDQSAISEGLGSELRCAACTPAFVRAAIGAMPGARAGEDYQPVPVAAARDLAHALGKDVIVILAYDLRSHKVHVTTYGRTVEWKGPAAKLGDICAKAAGLGAPDAWDRFEDFRLRSQASLTADIERLSAALKNYMEGGGRADHFAIAREAIAEAERNKVMALGRDERQDAGRANRIACQEERGSK